MFSNMPKSDIWKLIDKDINSLNHGKRYKFDFSYFYSESMKRVVKNYIWRNYIENNLALSTLNGHFLIFKYFNSFAKINNIVTFKDLDNAHVSMFMSFLKTSLSIQTNKPLSYSYQKNCLTTLKSIIRWGQLYMPDESPKFEIFTGNEYTGLNKKIKIKYIPDDVVKQINIALKNEKNPYIKYGIIILQSTGMRIGDMLKLKTNSLKPHLISGWTLSWYDHKKRKPRSPLPIPNECAIAIQKLIEHTQNLRQEASDDIKDYIFIHKIKNGRRNIIGKILKISRQCYRVWLNGNEHNCMIGFAERHQIKDSNGEIYKILTHEFRRTLATDMLSKGENILVIRDVLGHSAARTTRTYYAEIKDKERAEVFKNIGILGNVNMIDETILPDKEKLIWFNENKYKGARMCDGYCTKPFKSDEICDRLLKRQKCYTCSRYITTPEYLEIHKNYLNELEQELEDNIYGDHYAEHITPTIDILKEIIRRLEELSSGN